MTEKRDHSPDDIALAGEYALHLLDAKGRAAFEARLAQEPELRALLRDWDENLVLWSDEVSEVTPRPQVKTALENRLFGAEKTGFSWRSLFGRRLVTLAFAGIAVLAILVGPMVFNTSDAPRYLAQIVSEDRALVVMAAFDPGSAELSIDRTSGAAAPGRALELWLIAEGAEAPVSLGVISDEAQITTSIPPDLRELMINGTLAISDEPPGGSPTGAPTGVVLAAGKITLS